MKAWLLESMISVWNVSNRWMLFTTHSRAFFRQHWKTASTDYFNTAISPPPPISPKLPHFTCNTRLQAWCHWVQCYPNSTEVLLGQSLLPPVQEKIIQVKDSTSDKNLKSSISKPRLLVLACNSLRDAIKLKGCSNPKRQRSHERIIVNFHLAHWS